MIFDLRTESLAAPLRMPIDASRDARMTPVHRGHRVPTLFKSNIRILKPSPSRPTHILLRDANVLQRKVSRVAGPDTHLSMNGAGREAFIERSTMKHDIPYGHGCAAFFRRSNKRTEKKLSPKLPG